MQPPALNDVMWLLADNGYLAEVDGGALGVNRDAWTDERLLRSLALRTYSRSSVHCGSPFGRQHRSTLACSMRCV